ncbi:hypothetical protein Q9295_11235 [Xinfangfangia sp. CPCC 101601]|uniref:Uncharacterized protein n=1 Tax=Pseudogemmobacter lacusdianii TaxID=3069608 RepID=A0ABU0VYX5_9RHOB|nr:hypothetical protein [Xinfangfangia sp. CPCC 101601]MDQ2066951.1 hypothetical protein [Xinfangfangia sp. CPCC 101601]
MNQQQEFHARLERIKKSARKAPDPQQNYGRSLRSAAPMAAPRRGSWLSRILGGLLGMVIGVVAVLPARWLIESYLPPDATVSPEMMMLATGILGLVIALFLAMVLRISSLTGAALQFVTVALASSGFHNFAHYAPEPMAKIFSAEQVAAWREAEPAGSLVFLNHRITLASLLPASDLLEAPATAAAEPEVPTAEPAPAGTTSVEPMATETTAAAATEAAPTEAATTVPELPQRLKLDSEKPQP